ncbi:MAG: hypothetical protein M3Q99_00135 [Acidobacteriota bacterium]|nr:hypothetical protein [Acidobacteriota bacterium]
MCSVFGFTAMAQTNPDKPLDTKSLAALVEELKGIVAKSSPNEKDAELVADRWGKRTDLRGKTKKEVINLLYQDVKAVITDSGIQYQIYSIFSFYKQIPDEPPSDLTQKTNVAMSKPASVNKLVDLTYRMHPYVGIEEQLASLPGPADIKAATEEDRKNRIAGFDDALKVNNKLTSAQKSFVRANYDQLIKIADKITEDAIRTNFPTEQWVKEGLQKSYTSKFTQTELNSLIVYFQGVDGQQFLKYVRLSRMAQMITGNGGTVNLTEADKAQHDKFAATPLGKKFNAAYLQEVIAYEESKSNAVFSANPNADGFAIYRPENLNKLFNRFVAENYKK